MVSATEWRGGTREAPEGGGEWGELEGSQVQLQTEELGTRLTQAARGRPRRRWQCCAAGPGCGAPRGMGGVAASVWFTSVALPRSRPRPLTTRRPHPSASLRPTSCLRPCGPGRTSFAKLGCPGPWQEVPSGLAVACWPLEASLSSRKPGLPCAGPLPPAPCLGADPLPGAGRMRAGLERGPLPGVGSFSPNPPCTGEKEDLPLSDLIPGLRSPHLHPLPLPALIPSPCDFSLLALQTLPCPPRSLQRVCDAAPSPLSLPTTFPGRKASRSHHPGGEPAEPSLGTLSSSPSLSRSPRALGRVNTDPSLPPARPSSGSCSISCSPCKHSPPARFAS